MIDNKKYERWWKNGENCEYTPLELSIFCLKTYTVFISFIIIGIAALITSPLWGIPYGLYHIYHFTKKY